VIAPLHLPAHVEALRAVGARDLGRDARAETIAIRWIEQVVRRVDLRIERQRADEVRLPGAEIAVGITLALGGGDQFEADRIAERLLEQQRAYSLEGADQRGRARIVGFVVDRAEESVESEDAVTPAEIVFAEGQPG